MRCGCLREFAATFQGSPHLELECTGDCLHVVFRASEFRLSMVRQFFLAEEVVEGVCRCVPLVILSFST